MGEVHGGRDEVYGTYGLFRNHFGAPSRKALDGREVGATLGLLRSLLMLLTTPGVTHVAYTFDHVIESFRRVLSHQVVRAFAEKRRGM